VALSYNRVVASGSTNVFSVPFPYLDKSHVKVKFDGVLQDASTYTWPTDGTIQITAGNPTAGTVLDIRRETPVGTLVTFKPGNLDDADLNVGHLQPLFLAQEADDVANNAWFTKGGAVGGTIQKGAAGYHALFDVDGNIVPGAPSGTPSVTIPLAANTFLRVNDLGDAITGEMKVPIFVSDRVALRALDVTRDTLVYLNEPGREGVFAWRAGDYSAHVAADTGYDLQLISTVWTEVLIAGHVADEGVYVKADAVAATAGAWVRQFNGPIMVDWFGADGVGGNGVNNTAAIRAAFKVAQLLLGVVSDKGGKTFEITSTVYVKNGVRGFVGGGSVYKAMAPIVMFLFKGKHVDATRVPTSEPSNVQNIRVLNLNVDCNDQIGGSGLRVLKGDNLRDAWFVGNILVNTNHGLGLELFTHADGTDPTRDVVVSKNIIRGRPGEAGSGSQGRFFPIHFGSQLDTPSGAVADPVAYYQANGGVAITSSLPARSVTVVENIVDGGYYGFTGICLRDSVIANNRFTNNVRGIALEWTALNNDVLGNHIKENLSAGIMANYGCSFTLIDGNTIETGARWEGEALIKVGLNSHRCTISNNKTNANGTYAPVFPLAGSEYHIYVHTDANYTQVIWNHLAGDCYRAYIGVETAWQNSIVDIRHFAQGKSNDNFAFATMIGVEICDNTIDASFANKAVGAAADAIYLGAITDDTAGPLNLTDCVVARNHVTSNKHEDQLSILEQGGALVLNCTLMDNVFERLSVAAQFDLPRGRQHWVRQEGNSFLDDQAIAGVFSAADTTPSVRGGVGGVNGNTGGRRFNCSGNVGITFFDDGVIGQVIEVRGDATSTIVHNPALIHLKGATNAALGSPNNFIVLENMGGVWTELRRSF